MSRRGTHGWIRCIVGTAALGLILSACGAPDRGVEASGPAGEQASQSSPQSTLRTEAQMSPPDAISPSTRASGITCQDPEDTMDDELVKAHPAFTRHFSAPIYDDPANELAPFGSDEGWDLLFTVAQRCEELTDTATLDDVLALADVPVADEWGENPEGEQWYEDATFVAAAGFTLLRLTGQIDPAGHQRTLQAVNILIDYFGEHPDLLQQRADLHSWPTESTRQG